MEEHDIESNESDPAVEDEDQPEAEDHPASSDLSPTTPIQADSTPSVGLCELVLIVKDVERAAAFYRDVVGLVPEQPPENNWAWFWAGEPGNAQRIAVHAGTLLFGEHSPHPRRKRWGHVHFALNVPRERVDAALARVQEADVEVYGPVDFEWMNARSWYFYDPDGNLVEFWSPNVD